MQIYLKNFLHNFFGLKFIDFNVNLRKEFGKFLKIYFEI